MVEKLRAKGVSYEHTWHVEPNPAGTGYHVHAYQHGDDPTPYIAEVAASAAIGWTDVVAYTHHTGPIDYGMKMAADPSTSTEYLRVNGNRLGHHTRRFYRDAEGNPCSLSVAPRQKENQVNGRQAHRRQRTVPSAAPAPARPRPLLDPIRDTLPVRHYCSGHRQQRSPRPPRSICRAARPRPP